MAALLSILDASLGGHWVLFLNSLVRLAGFGGYCVLFFTLGGAFGRLWRVLCVVFYFKAND
jgi:hypothetical protein